MSNSVSEVFNTVVTKVTDLTSNQTLHNQLHKSDMSVQTVQ
jgi:hypothetical protein